MHASCRGVEAIERDHRLLRPGLPDHAEGRYESDTVQMAFHQNLTFRAPLTVLLFGTKWAAEPGLAEWSFLVRLKVGIMYTEPYAIGLNTIAGPDSLSQHEPMSAGRC